MNTSQSSVFVATIKERYPALDDDALQRVRRASHALGVAELMWHLEPPGTWPQSATEAEERLAPLIGGLNLSRTEHDARRSELRQDLEQIEVFPQSLPEAIESMAAAIDALNLPRRARAAIRRDAFRTIEVEQRLLEYQQQMEARRQAV